MDEGVDPFRDRAEAGRLLAEKLGKYADRSDVIVLALPRGGVPIGFEIAQRLKAALDVFVVRKLGVPGHEELAMGALATGNVIVLQTDIVEGLGISQRALESVIAKEKEELRRRERAYRSDSPLVQVRGRTVILVDDGLATGATMQAAVAALRKQKPARIVVAVPVAAASTCEQLARVADEMICARTPEPFYAVGMWYGNFSPVSDSEVRELLERARQTQAAESSQAPVNRSA